MRSGSLYEPQMTTETARMILRARLKKEMVVLENQPWRSLRLVDEKTTADSKIEGDNTGYTRTRDLHGAKVKVQCCFVV